MFNPDGKPSVPLPKFSKHLHGTESNDEQGSEGVTLRLGLHQQVPGTSRLLGRGRRRWGGGSVPEGAKFLLQPEQRRWLVSTDPLLMGSSSMACSDLPPRY